LRCPLIVGVLVALVGCTARDGATSRGNEADASAPQPASPEQPIDFHYEVGGNGESNLALKRVSTIRLGARIDETPTDVRSLIVQGRRIFVLDGKMRRLRGYDIAGKLVFNVGKWGKDDGEMDTPVALKMQGDTLMLLDLSHVDHVKLYSLDGEYLTARVFPLPEGATSFEVSRERMVFATLSGRQKYSLSYAMMGTDNHGHVLWLGCQADPQYAASDKAHEMASKYAFRTVASSADRLYCIQPLSPLVQIYDTLGNFVGAFRRAPTFYKPPTHVAETQNVKEMLQYESQWTLHAGIFAFPGGILSVYQTYDLQRGAMNYLLFRCDSLTTATPNARCATAKSPGQPVGLVGTDTLLVVGRDDKTQIATLSRYLIRVGR
jgi:hypothetical protein